MKWKRQKLRTIHGYASILVISNDSQFLASFAQNADGSRLVVWETKILVVTLLPPEEMRHLMLGHWTYSMFNAMFLNLVETGKNTSCDSYRYFFYNNRYDVHSFYPYTPDGGQVLRVALWTSRQGLRLLNAQQLFPEKYQNKHVYFLMSGPYAYFMALEEDNSVSEDYDVIENMIQNTTNNDSGKNKYSGRDYIMLQVLAQLFNFTIRILPVASWDEVIEKVIERVAFMSPLRIAILPHLLPHLDFSADFEPETLTFVMAKPSLKPHWQSLLYPLREVVWISVGIVLLVALPVFYLVFHFDKEVWGGTLVLSWWSVSEIVLGTLLSQGLTQKLPNTNSVRLVIFFWMVFVFVIGAVYRGNLTAFLTLPKYPQRIETLQQLVDARASMLIPPDTVDFFNGFQQSPPGPYKDISQRMTFVPSIHVAFPRLLKESTAYMYERRNLDLNIARHYTKRDGWTPFYTAKENIWPGTCAWPIIRDAPFRHILDRYIGIFVQAGLVDHWSDEIIYKFRSRSRSQKTSQTEQEALFGEDLLGTTWGDGGQEDIKPLSVVHLQGPLLLLMLCLLGSSLTFAAEVILRFKKDDFMKPLGFEMDALEDFVGFKREVLINFVGYKEIFSMTL
ncbi:uncharacterized protein LOC135208089 [Macrobrachium nipponense]|uniref:uncharacterized protein LOC135208089 n=1 Tax=Macrobrachium nipponense TaxID=159736 RepID=UPI0030C8647C